MTTLNDIPPFSITSPKGKQDYYYPLEYYKEFGNSIPVKRKLPSEEETIEYMNLLKEKRQCTIRRPSMMVMTQTVKNVLSHCIRMEKRQK